MTSNNLNDREIHHTGRGWRPPSIAIVLLLGLLTSGCSAEGQLPTVELSATAIAPVGRVIPVYIERRCIAHCGFKSIQLIRQEITARNESGKYVQPMLPDDAAELAGGTETLLYELNSRELNGSFIARNAGSEYMKAGESFGAGGAIAIPFILGEAGYMAAHPEEVRLQRLEEISIAQSTGGYYHDSGWIFFAIGKYTEIKAPYTWVPLSWSLFGPPPEEQTEMLTVPWNGSSITPASPTEPLPEGSGSG